jgi:hypothetical protein
LYRYSESAALFAAASGSDPPTIDLGSAAFISELATDSVAGAVEDGAMASAGDVSVSAITAVAGVSAGGEVLINRSTYHVKPFYLSRETVLPIKPFYLSNAACAATPRTSRT